MPAPFFNKLLMSQNAMSDWYDFKFMRESLLTRYVPFEGRLRRMERLAFRGLSFDPYTLT